MPAPSEALPTILTDVYPGISPDKYRGTLKGKVVIITGASRGLGYASAKAFAEAGASLYLVARNQDALKAAKQTFEDQFDVPVAYKATDATDFDSIKEFVQDTVDTYGKIDIVVANTGGDTELKLMGDTDPAVWWSTYELNFKAPAVLTSFVLPHLIKSKGYLIYVSSVAAQLRLPKLSAYYVSKNSGIRLADIVDVEHGKDGVKTFAVHPGSVRTDLAEKAIAALPEFEPLFTIKPELSAWTYVRLVSGTEDWLSGRFIDSTWSLDEVAKLKDAILEKDALKNRLALP